jgi:phosphoglycerate dehydrogenase-like enzyme
MTICPIQTNTRYESSPAIELTWALILASARNLIVETASVRSGGWQRTAGDGIRGKVLGILGLGNIEPLPQDHAFRQLDNVVATPHIGFVSRDLYRVFYQDTVANIATWLQRNPRL